MTASLCALEAARWEALVSGERSRVDRRRVGSREDDMFSDDTGYSCMRDKGGHQWLNPHYTVFLLIVLLRNLVYHLHICQHHNSPFIFRIGSLVTIPNRKDILQF